MPDQPLDHILRASAPPWRRPGHGLTECGRPAADVGHVVTRDEARARFKELGRQRGSLFFCMTCVTVAERWPTWDADPVGAISRETSGWRTDREPFLSELRALAALVEAHPDEFYGFLDGLAEAPSLDARRRARR